MKRCAWADGEYLVKYHDTRWCKPVHDDHELFALLILEGKQAGLSWSLILKREAGIRALCDDLRPESAAQYGEEQIQALLKDPRMIRSQAKIRALVTNAQAFLSVQKEFGSFDAYIWRFTDGQVIDHRIQSETDMPVVSELSQAVSKDLKKRGFKFVGPTIIYSYLQAIGIYNDHIEGCDFK